MFSCREAESFFGGQRPEIGTVARRLAMRSPIAISRWSLLVDRRASCDCAHDLDVFDFPLVHGVRIVCQHDEVRQPAALGGSRACSMRRNTHPLFFLPTDPFLSSASSSWCQR